jgi:hypothetical protein
MTEQTTEFDVIEPLETQAQILSRRIVEALNDGDEAGAESLHARLVEAETASWNPEFKV